MGAFEIAAALDERHRAEFGIKDSHRLTGRAGKLADAMQPLGSVRPSLKSRYLVKGWLDRGASSVLYAESNAGKTFMALDLAMHVAAGMDWHGHRVPTGDKWAGPVVYVATEGGRGVHNRIEAMRRDNPALMAAAEADGRFLLMKEPLDLCTSDDSQWLADALDTLPRRPSLIVVDTLARAMGNGDENTAKDMGQIVRSIDHLRAVTGAHVMLIHHSGKDASKGARGSGSLRAAVDTEIELTRADGVIMAEARKQRDMPCEGVFAFTLKSVFLGFDEDGDAVTSAVVTATEVVTRKSRVKLTGTDKIGMQALSDALAHHGEIKRGDMFPGNRQTVTLERWREFCDRHSLSSGESESAARVAFHKLKRRLQDKELVKIVDGFVWPVGSEAPQALAPLPAVTSNEANAGHAAVTAVTALYKSGNAVTQTQPGDSPPVPMPEAWTRSGTDCPAPSPAKTLPDPEAFNPEMWR